MLIIKNRSADTTFKVSSPRSAGHVYVRALARDTRCTIRRASLRHRGGGSTASLYSAGGDVGRP